MIRFGRFELDATQGLSRGGKEVRLTPKSLAVLRMLAERAGRVVTKDELFGSVWADTAVTDSALATCIQEIRHALNDDARTPRFIETMHRRGYRFVARTSQTEAEERPAPARMFRHETPFVGRDAEIEAVLDASQAARQATRQICFIIGEPGVGKTAVLNECLAHLGASGGVAMTSAQCVEQYGSGEPYQPLLDALMRLCRQPGGTRIVGMLERYAPMWLAQLPGLLAPRPFAALQRTIAGASRDRMLRELTNVVEMLAGEDLLILAIEDLHWSDPSTLDWIATVATRPEPAKVLILATLRPPTPGEPEGPLSLLRDTLLPMQVAREVKLQGLDETDISRYLAARLPPAPGREPELSRLSRRLHNHTGGNPLFMASVVDQLVERRVVFPVGDGWAASEDAEVADLGIPDTIRRLIERQLARLPSRERQLLESASVVGDRFAVAVVASAADVDVEEAESGLTSTASQPFVRERGDEAYPDGAVATDLSFVHTLFREALYRGLPRGRQIELHRRVGEFQERARGPRAVEIAAELAVHFERGRDVPRAVRYLQHAAENARRRSAFKEARVHYDRALGLLDRLPESSERTERELDLQMGLGATIMATNGFGAPDVEAAYSRARSLSQRISDTTRLFPALWGLWLFDWGRGEVRTSDEQAHQLRALAEASEDQGLRLQALHASWATAFSQGSFDAACLHATEGLKVYDVEWHAPMAATYGSHDAGVCARMFAARALAFLGPVDQAILVSDEAIAHARFLGHPFSTALSLSFRAALDQSCGDVASAGAHAAEGIAIARDQGLGLTLAWCSTIGGWAAARQGDHVGGLNQISEGIAAARRSGSDQFQPYLLGMLADACLSAGRFGRGIEAVREALAMVDRKGERFYEAELHRLNGDLILAAGGEAAEAEAAFRKALALARAQGAATLVLRTAIRLGRMASRPDIADPGRGLLHAARVAIPPGVRLPDTDEADLLLVQ